MSVGDALALYRAGRFAEAESVCLAILRGHPADFAAVHLLGLIMLRTGRADQAVASLEQAVLLLPNSVEARNNLAAALRALGRDAEALACYDTAISLRPDHAESHYNRAILLRGLGRSAEALASYDAAIVSRPDFAPAHLNRGNLLGEMNDPAAALAAFDRAIASRPDFAEAHGSRGAVLVALGRGEDALASYDRAVALRPGHAETHYQRANLLRDLRRFDDACASYDQAIARQPDHPRALNNRGNVLRDLGRPDAALASYDRAIAAHADFAEAHFNRGTVLRELGRPEEAIASHDRAIALKLDFAEAFYNRGNALRDLDRLNAAGESYRQTLKYDPNHAEAWYSLGAVLWDQGLAEAALEHYERAVALKPDLVEAQYNKGICHLALGDYEHGWRGFEWRWKSRYVLPRNDLPGHAWDGRSPIDGKTILVHAEAGFGDSLQICRYLPVLASRATVVAQVPAALVRLFSRLRGVAQVMGEDAALPRFDAWIPMMSLPLAFGSTLATIPAEVPYLYSDPERSAPWRRRLAELPGRKIGLVWAGSPLRGMKRAEAMDRRRSIALAYYAPLAAIRGLCFVSLQKGEPARQARTPPAGMVLHDWTDELEDFADTGDLIDALDLVITVDTAVAHLAGALGKPVWILNRYDQCWRWLRDRTDSPWYPTARLFRQRSPGNWSPVIDEVVEALRSHALSGSGEGGGNAR